MLNRLFFLFYYIILLSLNIFIFYNNFIIEFKQPIFYIILVFLICYILIILYRLFFLNYYTENQKFLIKYLFFITVFCNTIFIFMLWYYTYEISLIFENKFIKITRVFEYNTLKKLSYNYSAKYQMPFNNKDLEVVLKNISTPEALEERIAFIKMYKVQAIKNQLIEDNKSYFRKFLDFFWK